MKLLILHRKEILHAHMHVHPKVHADYRTAVAYPCASTAPQLLSGWVLLLLPKGVVGWGLACAPFLSAPAPLFSEAVVSMIDGGNTR